jgi:hypothetical protein
VDVKPQKCFFLDCLCVEDDWNKCECQWALTFSQKLQTNDFHYAKVLWENEKLWNKQ